MIVDLPLAPFAILAFLGSCLAELICLALFLHPAVRKNRGYRRALLTLLFGGIGLYGIVLIGFSLTSHEHVLPRGAEKHFCEVDCHLAYSIADVQIIHTPSAGNANHSALPESYYLVTLRTRFDETTINPQRGNGILYPNPREIWALDEQGNRYAPLAENAAQIASATRSTALTQPLRPGESYTTSLLFELPASVHSPKLFVSNAPWPNRFLIGHENSPLHRKAYFAL